MRSSRKPAGSFIAMLVAPDIDTKVLVPPHFSRKYTTCLSRGLVRLRVGTGKTWPVKVETVEEEEGEMMYALTCGWDAFFRDAALRYGDFVIFKLAGSTQRRASTFDVSVFGIHGCQCLVPDDHDHDTEGMKSFTVNFQERHTPSMMIPKGMAREGTGIKAGEWIKLRNGEGEEWGVEVQFGRAGNAVGNVYLKEGWRAFWEENNMCFGNELRFELVDTDPPTLLVVVTKEIAEKAKPGRPRKN